MQIKKQGRNVLAGGKRVGRGVASVKNEGGGGKEGKEKITLTTHHTNTLSTGNRDHTHCPPRTPPARPASGRRAGRAARPSPRRGLSVSPRSHSLKSQNRATGGSRTWTARPATWWRPPGRGRPRSRAWLRRVGRPPCHRRTRRRAGRPGWRHTSPPRWSHWLLPPQRTRWGTRWGRGQEGWAEGWASSPTRRAGGGAARSSRHHHHHHHRPRPASRAPSTGSQLGGPQSARQRAGGRRPAPGPGCGGWQSRPGRLNPESRRRRRRAPGRRPEAPPAQPPCRRPGGRPRPPPPPSRGRWSRTRVWGGGAAAGLAEGGPRAAEGAGATAAAAATDLDPSTDAGISATAAMP